jgi:Protein of unknown function DUF262
MMGEYSKKGQEIISTESMNVRVGSLYQDRKRFSNYPPFQRDKVWGLRMKQVFIDSMLRKLPINSCMLMEDVDENGAGIYQVIDGQQRLETVFDFFDNLFPTMTEMAAKGGLLIFDPIEPGCLFKQLSRAAQNRLQDYKLPFVTFAKEQEDILEEIFIRTNNQEPLSVGEQLFIRNSRARQIAMTLLKHSFWNTRYTGKTLRKDNFQATLQLIIIELLGFPVHLGISHQSLSPLNRLILGEYDDGLSDTLQNTIWKRLTTIEHVFEGANIRNKRDIIPVYEACILLDTEGFDLQRSKAGCLTEWFFLSKRGSTIEQIRSYRPFARIDFQAFQKAFWDSEAEAIQHVPGLVKRSNETKS